MFPKLRRLFLSAIFNYSAKFLASYGKAPVVEAAHHIGAVVRRELCPASVRL
jgi:hypothetical protein